MTKEKEQLAKCPECEELSNLNEFERVDCFKLSDFKNLASEEREFILFSEVEKMVDENMTIECFKCPYCEKLLEEDELKVYKEK